MRLNLVLLYLCGMATLTSNATLQSPSFKTDDLADAADELFIQSTDTLIRALRCAEQNTDALEEGMTRVARDLRAWDESARELSPRDYVHIRAGMMTRLKRALSMVLAPISPRNRYCEHSGFEEADLICDEILRKNASMASLSGSFSTVSMQGGTGEGQCSPGAWIADCLQDEK